MANYIAPTCQNDTNNVTTKTNVPKTDDLLADFECIGSDGNDGSKPRPTATAASEAPAEASTAETENTGDIPADVVAKISSLKVELKDGVLTMVSSSSSPGAPVELSTDLLSALQALTTRATETAAKADAPAARATSPAPMSEERRAVVKRAKRAAVVDALAEQQALESASDKVVRVVRDQKKAFEDLVAAQEKLDQQEINILEGVIELLKDRVAKRKIKSDLYQWLLFNSASTNENGEERKTELKEAMETVGAYTQHMLEFKAAEGVREIERRLGNHETELMLLAIKAGHTRDQRLQIKKALSDQDAIVQSLQDELSKL